ncbi:subtilisin-like protease SBT3.9 isoform X1 [Selaginella moellendorffii]|nr:subtilisin-like protease SBT3.9 isoform X1 [Selaginella moellendorffii]|eukprot:XP_002979023.2 subtilisin-like protease SBT3.9 isoform X1 [Selaginella moellendorffii]
MAPLIAFLILLAQIQCSMGEVYIVYMGKKTIEDHELVTKSHHETLASVLGSEDLAKSAILYSYRHGFSGFAADMNPGHAKALSKMPGVVSVFRSKKVKLHTTHSWDFLGLDVMKPKGILQESGFGVDVIVGVVDSGVWPEAESFNDKSMPAVPTRWKGICQIGENFTASNCNRKLIGARYFDQSVDPSVEDYRSPRDKNSHGTHTSSTAVGRLVYGASDDEFGSGIARGGAPMARLAMYKFYEESSSLEADIISAIDYAIYDGVDILSISAGMENTYDYNTDGIAIAAFHAVQNGILVVASGGNSGPYPSTIINTAPWILSVGASTIDRGFHAKIVLPDNATSCQATPSQHRTGSKVGLHGIASGENGYCTEATLNGTTLRGKYVLCFASSAELPVDMDAIEKAGATGIIITDTARSITGTLSLPIFVVPSACGVQLLGHRSHEKSSTIYIHPPETVTGIGPAPAVATFSARGPNPISPDILKPDIIAPGVDIIAAIPPKNHSSSSAKSFGAMSGTSMSCPHVSGVAALLKSLHPDWSPSAIKSAIMTTAWNMDNTRDIITDSFTLSYSNPFGYGAGHINPTKAADPGLVYVTTPQDYALFCCSLGSICKIEHSKCSSQTLAATELNYPSITISNLVGTKTVKRVVTNVGTPYSSYRAIVEEPHSVRVTVKPDNLHFNSSVTKLSYEITFEAAQIVRSVGHYAFGSITWSDGVHYVRSPISVQVNDFIRA